MRITLIGAGAIGTLWAVKLSQAGHHVHLITRDSADKRALNLDDTSLTLPANQPDLLRYSDLWLVCTKSYDVQAALTPCFAHLEPETMVMLMHNGMGPHQWLIDTLPASQPLLLATTSQGVFRAETGEYRHTGNGPTALGAGNQAGEACQFLADVLDHALPAATWQSDILESLWYKLAVNSVINPLTALHGIKNGELLKRDYAPIIDALCQELATVMRAERILASATEVRQRVETVAKATADNYSSMNRDVFYRRPTELAYITGYVLQRAQAHQISTPHHQQLHQAVQQVER
ncbi:2-dehydropantoate 2-reductase [Salinivibrio kushneri]|uniref:2-dehydropantoate 2-reductase n=1 Tax=Salinivibrio kushneri TaxID=1908198 RepID=UPI0022B3C3F6|nr:2-dehydropantoate 2-reductase [Salinivibrio kushneri]WBA18533.1 2-dehydropantoate 2-reductase [Salinivibrio kushneri]